MTEIGDFAVARLVSGYTIGAFIHVFLVVAIVLFLIRAISGRRYA
jgi:hypothetical protein